MLLSSCSSFLVTDTFSLLDNDLFILAGLDMSGFTLRLMSIFSIIEMSEMVELIEIKERDNLTL